MARGGETRGDEEVLRALDDLIDALEETSQRNRDVLRRARTIRRLRERGTSYRDIVSSEAEPLIVELMTANIASLSRTGRRFREAEARALHGEGMSMERIAALFGVTRQRVSALLKGSKRKG